MNLKTIEERAKEYAAKSWSEIPVGDFNEDHVTFENIVTEAYFAGAQSKHAELTRWHDIQADPKWGFATDYAIDEIFRSLPRLIMDKRDRSIELIDYDNAAEWRGDLERTPYRYQWRPIHE